ncbi:MAG: hypothetical protein H6R10_1051 [Rhodocyclaceae bacterium]|nr:hypothetical protein [Rhodocyclaceae bacterium]
MIHAALFHLAGQLNEFLTRGLGLAEDMVVVSNLLDPDGSVAPGVANKLVLFLTNIQKDTTPGNMPAASQGEGPSGRRYPPVHLNLYVMVAASFSGSNYPEALKMISAAILFFQKHPVFDRRSSPGLDRRIDKLTLDIENLGTQDLASLWGVLSGKYLPSVLYRVRMVTFDSQDIQALEPTVRQPESRVAT